MVKIYALKNKADGSIFYVGATQQPLKIRLNNHIYSRKNKDIEIVLLEEAKLENANEREKYYYEYYLNLGCQLEQNPKLFTYYTKYGNADVFNKENGAKEFTLRPKLSLYSSLKKYRDENGLPSISSVVIYILNQFFKNPI